jgi:Subtilisin inhibitor-like
MKASAPLTGTRRAIGAAILLGPLAAVAACGGPGPASHAAGVNSAPGRAGPKPASSLTISVTAVQGGKPRRWTLTCDPAGGSHPDPQAACATLAQAKDPFAPVSPRVMCPMIASGPQTASITGVWNGQRVSATYSRVNGCQTSRWNELNRVLGQVNPGGPMIPASGAGSSG